MARKKMMAANWKMNLTGKDLEPYFISFKETLGLRLARCVSSLEVVIAPSHLFLAKAIRLSEGMGLTVASQNFYHAAKGAFTGETSLAMLAELGVSTAICGHSERRNIFLEDDPLVAHKVKAMLASGGRAIFCCGENLEERRSKRTVEIITRQVSAVLSEVDSLAGLYIAYEPVWAIGTGQAASPAEAQEVHSLIRSLVSMKKGAEAAAALVILYGGSVTEENLEALLTQADIDGALVGGASLNPVSFANLVKICANSSQL